jgi:uncharacterized membrane protein
MSTTPQPTRSVKPLVIALLVSVSLNMFGAGVLAATRYARRNDRPRPDFALGPKSFLDGAGVGDDPAVRGVLESRRHKLLAGREAMMQHRAAIRDALAAEPFARDKLEAALAQLRTHAGEMQTEMHTALVELAATLPADKRARLASAPWLLGPHEGREGRGPRHMR